MKTLKATLLTAAAGIILCVPAAAQREPIGLSLEVGGNYATDSDVRDNVGDIGLRVGLGYQLPTASLLGRDNGGRPSVNVSYTHADDHLKLTTWGFTYEERVPFQAYVRPGAASPYWGLGVGVFHSKAKFEEAIYDAREVAAGEGPSYSDSESKTNLGARVILGADFSTRYYVEGSYNFTGKVADGRTDSLALVVGARF